MEKTDLNQRAYYRALKVFFIFAFIITQMIGAFFAHLVASKTKGYTYGELIYFAAKPTNGSKEKEGVKQSLLTQAVRDGIKPSDIQRQLIGKTLISDLDFQNLKTNIEKLINAGVKNQEINSYVSASFEDFDRGKHIQSFPDSPQKLEKYKYNIYQRIGIYVLSFAIVLLLFWIIARIFFYIIIGEKFFKVGLK